MRRVRTQEVKGRESRFPEMLALVPRRHCEKKLKEGMGIIISTVPIGVRER